MEQKLRNQKNTAIRLGLRLKKDDVIFKITGVDEKTGYDYESICSVYVVGNERYIVRASK